MEFTLVQPGPTGQNEGVLSGKRGRESDAAAQSQDTRILKTQRLT